MKKYVLLILSFILTTYAQDNSDLSLLPIAATKLEIGKPINYKISNIIEENIPANSLINLVEADEYKGYDSFALIQLKMQNISKYEITSDKGLLNKIEILPGLIMLLVKPMEQNLSIKIDGYLNNIIKIRNITPESERSYLIEDVNNFAGMMIITEPEGCKIINVENNVLFGIGNSYMPNLNPGNYRIRLEKSGYRYLDFPISIPVQLEVGKCWVSKYKLYSETVKLVVKTPKRVDISINKQRYSSNTLLQIPRGDIELSIKDRDYLWYDTTIVVDKEEMIEINPRLYTNDDWGKIESDIDYIEKRNPELVADIKNRYIQFKSNYKNYKPASKEQHMQMRESAIIRYQVEHIKKKIKY